MDEIKSPQLFRWQDCSLLNIGQIQELYKKYVSASQVDLFGSFGFGRTTVTKAEGMYLYTSDGKKILDFTGGLGVLNHGHNHPRILKARQEFQQQHRPEVTKNYLSGYIAGLSHNIAQLLPEGLETSYFCNSGAEAVEGAVKLAYKFHDGKRNHILHSDISFHGKLLGAAGLTGNPEHRFKFPTIPNIGSFKHDDINDIKRLVGSLRKDTGDSDIYAIVVEPFNGGCLLPCSNAFLKELRSICSQENIVLIFDEVYTGWAKCGELFYFMKHGVVPDIVTYSKSFGGGKSSISGYTCRQDIFKSAYDNLNDANLHSTTYNGFGEECITAIEAINIVIEEDYTGKSKRIEKRIQNCLKDLQGKYPDLVQETRGCGALHGIILNPDLGAGLNATLKNIPHELFKDPRFSAKLVTSAVISELYNSHDILTIFTPNRDIPLVISPSLIVTDEEIDHFFIALDKVLSKGKIALLKDFILFKYFNIKVK